MFYLVVDVRIGNWMRNTGCRMVLRTDSRYRMQDPGYEMQDILDLGSRIGSTQCCPISDRRAAPDLASWILDRLHAVLPRPGSVRSTIIGPKRLILKIYAISV